MNAKAKTFLTVKQFNLFLIFLALLGIHAAVWHVAGLDWIEGVFLYFTYAFILRVMQFIAVIGIAGGVYPARNLTLILISMLLYYSGTVIYAVGASLWPTVLIVIETLVWAQNGFLHFSGVVKYWKQRTGQKVQGEHK